MKVGDLSDVTIERPQAEVGPDDIERTIEMLRRQRTRYEPASRARPPTAIASIVDFTGRIDGVEFPGGQATRLRDRPRRRPDAAGVRDRASPG